MKTTENITVKFGQLFRSDFTSISLMYFVMFVSGKLSMRAWLTL